MITAYVDESGTHQGSKVLVVAAYIGTSRVWESVEARFKRSDKYAGVPFHAADCAQGGKKYRGMGKDKRYRITMKNIRVVNDHDIFGVACGAWIDEYATVSPRNGQHWETWLQDAFKGVFSTVLTDLYDHAEQRYPKEKLSLAMDDSQYWYPTAAQWFLAAKDTHPKLETIAPYSRKQAVQLYAPDLLAYETYLLKTRERAPTAHPPRQPLIALLQKRVEGRMWDKKAFEQLKEFIEWSKDKTKSEIDEWIRSRSVSS